LGGGAGDAGEADASAASVFLAAAFAVMIEEIWQPVRHSRPSATMPGAEARTAILSRRSYGEPIVAKTMMKERLETSSSIRCQVLKYAHLHLLSGR